MSHYPDPEALAANPPESWRVERVQVGSRARWRLFIDDSEHHLQTFDTKREALEERDNPNSYTRRAVEKERRWYAGITPHGWKSWEECRAMRPQPVGNYQPQQWP